VALYLAADGEIDTAAVATLARDADKEIYLPVICEDESLGFARWVRGAELTPNRYNIPEPPSGAIHREPDALDIILLPLVGWDRSGGRLGMGGGFYDRTLANVHGPVLVGCAHGVQEVDHLPLEAWDVRLDFVATESALHDCRE
jgi:5-formyltetrahydrofolate cyclo-ligase